MTTNSGLVYYLNSVYKSGYCETNAWGVDLEQFQSQMAHNYLVQLDLSAFGALPSNTTLTLSAFAKGEMAGPALGYGIEVLQWNPNTSTYVSIGTNSAQNLGDGNMTIPVDLTLKTTDKKVYILLRGAYGRGSTYPAEFELDPNDFRFGN